MRLASYFETQQSRVAARKVVRHGRRLGFLLFAVGVASLCLLPNEELMRKAFFDENALMAGLVRREFTGEAAIQRFSREIGGMEGSDGELVWFEGQLSQLGLEVYRQNYSATKLVNFQQETSSLSGSNVYGILRAGRAHSAEALVLSAPMATLGRPNHHGIVIMLSLAQYFKSKNYWAKDIVFLVTTNGDLGAQAWIDGYMGTTTAGISASLLPGRSGAIQAVINLEASSASVQRVDIIAEGVNGLLPNLDLVQVVLRLCELEGVATSFHTQCSMLAHLVLSTNRTSPRVDPECYPCWGRGGASTLPISLHHWLQGQLSPREKHYRALQTTVAIAAYQAPGLPIANHGLFLRHRIDSVTIRALGGERKDFKSLQKLGSARALLSAPPYANILSRALEGIFRSLNNLMEVLHHSEFFYFTASRQGFISLGRYMPPFGLLLAPLILEALSQWLVARIPDLLEGGGGDSSKDTLGIPMAVPFPFQSVMKLVLVSCVSGIFLYCSPWAASLLQHPLMADGLLVSLLGASALSLLLPVILPSLHHAGGWRMAKTASLLLLLLTLCALSMMNFSLAVLLTLLLSPVAILAQPRGISGRPRHCLRLLFTLILCPPIPVVLLISLYAHLSLPDTAASAGWAMAVKGAVDAYNSWYLVGSWIYPVACLVVWPLWLMPWALCWQRLEIPATHSHSD